MLAHLSHEGTICNKASQRSETVYRIYALMLNVNMTPLIPV